MNGLTAQIDAAYAEEVDTGQPATELDQIPISYAHLSTEWLTKLLCQEHPGAEVVGFDAVDADDLNRGHKRVGLEYNETGRSSGLPASVFCKDSQRLELRYFNALLIAREVQFYQQIQPILGLETPNCLLSNYDTRSYNSLLVFEDLRCLGTDFCTERTSVTKQRAEDQIRHLARLHARFHGEVETNSLLHGLGTLADTYDQVQEFYGGKLQDEADRGFLASESVMPSRLFARLPEVWPATAHAIEIQRARSVTFTHNDPHIRNWYLTPRGDMRLGDWQLVGRGDWSFDLCFTMATSLAVDDRRAWERELLELYIEQVAAQGGPRIEFAEAWDNYRIQLFVALAWWTPAVKPSADFEFQPLESTLTIIQRIASALDDLDSFSVLAMV